MKTKNAPQHFRQAVQYFRQETFLPFLEIVSAVVILVNHSRLFVLIVIRLHVCSCVGLLDASHEANSSTLVQQYTTLLRI